MKERFVGNYSVLIEMSSHISHVRGCSSKLTVYVNAKSDGNVSMLTASETVLINEVCTIVK